MPLDLSHLVFDWNRADIQHVYVSSAPTDTVSKVFESIVRKTPHRPAIFTEHATEVSYQQVDSCASEIARNVVQSLTAAFPNLDVSTSCIMVALPRCAALPITLLASVKSGACYCAVDLTLQSPAVVIKYLHLLRCPIIVTDEASRKVLFPNNAPAEPIVQCIVAHDGTVVQIILPFQSQSIVGSADVGAAGSFACPKGTMYIEFTSGSTGEPKAVAVTHSCCLSLVRNCHKAFLWDSNTRGMLYHTVAFDVHVTDLWGPWAHGGCAIIVAVSLKDIKAVWDIGRLARATHLSMTPFGFSIFTSLHFQFRSGTDYSNLKLVLVCGEALDFSSLQIWFAEEHRPTFVNGYSITETTVLNTFLVVQPEQVQWPSSIGRRLPHTCLLLLDDNLNPVPHGETGELYLAGDCVAHGYITSKEKNDTSFLATPKKYLDLLNVAVPEMPCSTIYKTGDLGHYSEEFCGIVFHGRADNEIKIAGFRVHPGEVEKTINQFDIVKEAVVVPVKHPDGRTVIFCYLRPSKKGLTKPEILSQIRQNLADYKVPQFHFIDDDFKFPSTASSKIDRTALSRMALPLLV